MLANTTVVGNKYQIVPDTRHRRVRQVQFCLEGLEEFLHESSSVSLQTLEYIPYERFIMAQRLLKICDHCLGNELWSILNDRSSGAFTVSLGKITEEPDELIKFATAITYLIGLPNIDVLSGKYYARFLVSQTSNADSYLFQPNLFSLHTDGSFFHEPTDWLLLMVIKQQFVQGGESLLLHLDDWEEGKKLASDPLAEHPFIFKGPPASDPRRISWGNHRDVEQVRRSIFYREAGELRFCFIDQFVQPETLKQAQYLKQIADSLHSCPQTHSIALCEGELYVINNTFWIHGRNSFQRHENLLREAMRIRGKLVQTCSGKPEVLS
jgi:protein CsiD